MSIEATLATWELTKKDVCPIEKMLLLSFARRAGEDHTCWPSLKRIAEDTGLDRKTIIEYRKKLIDKKLLKYTGRMVGRSGQIPEMQLLYVEKWEQKRNSPRLKDDEEPVDKSGIKDLTSTVNGTSTSTVCGTSTSTVYGTLNSKEEKINRNKSFCVTKPKKTKADWREENGKVHAFADDMNHRTESQKQMAREAKHIEESNAFKRSAMPESLREQIRQLRMS